MRAPGSEPYHSHRLDEVQWPCGHRYLTLVYQIDIHCKRLLRVGNKRKVKTLLGFFCWFGIERTAALKFVCSDMWKPYLRVIAKKAGKAVHVLDRFHIMVHLNKTIDVVRAGEAKARKAVAMNRCSRAAVGCCSSVRRTSARNRRSGWTNCCDTT